MDRWFTVAVEGMNEWNGKHITKKKSRNIENGMTEIQLWDCKLKVE